MKWHDARTENRREVNYVIREAGEDVFLCLLVDAPLRIAGSPDLVSVRLLGRTIIRCEVGWECAATVWEGGAEDDEGLVRICSTDCFHARGEELRQDLTRMIREYRQGTRVCHDLVSRPPDSPAVGRNMSAPPEGPAVVTEDVLRKHLAPVTKAVEDGNELTVTAVTKAVTRGIDQVAPQTAADRARSVMLWLQRYPGISALELRAAAMRLDRLPYTKIAKALAAEFGIHMTREGARKICLRIEEKTREDFFEKKDNYGRADKAARAARAVAERDAMDRRLDGESEEEN
jgi:antitoxin (DNA-binding transcriptional repressor) of toxin-antitoxin stability system